MLINGNATELIENPLCDEWRDRFKLRFPETIGKKERCWGSVLLREENFKHFIGGKCCDTFSIKMMRRKFRILNYQKEQTSTKAVDFNLLPRGKAIVIFWFLTSSEPLCAGWIFWWYFLCGGIGAFFRGRDRGTDGWWKVHSTRCSRRGRAQH